MNLRIPIDKKDINRAVLSILNFTTQLTITELSMISMMMDNNLKILTMEARRKLGFMLNKDKHTINNHFKRLKEKGVLVVSEDNKSLCLNPNLVVTVEQSITDEQINIELYVND